MTTLPKELPCETIIDNIADGVFTVDLNWNISFFNNSAEKITGVLKKQAIGRKCWQVFNSSLCSEKCALKSCIDSNITINNKAIYFINSNGEKVPVSICAGPLYDKKGQLIGGVESFRDLTAVHLMKKKINNLYTFEDIISKNNELKKIFNILPQIAKSPSTVILLGESGTGKELFARAVHNVSLRKKNPFIVVNCGAIPENLLESELFGYKSGAFTDAKKDKAGKFALAEGGTIFLDEIGDMPLSTQVKILRAIQDKTFEPLGGIKSIKANVRIIAATNKDLKSMMEKGLFREDLYYRLNVVQLILPPLRKRTEDIPLLINHFIGRLNALNEKQIIGVSEEALSFLVKYKFPGNVRELENILEYAFLICQTEHILIEHLPDHLVSENSHQSLSCIAVEPVTMEDFKYHAVIKTLKRNQGKKMKAARDLNISKDTLRRILQKNRIDRSDHHQDS